MIKILQNGIKHDNGYTPCFYSMGNNTRHSNRCITIYARDYEHLPAELGAVENDTDTQTDYFDSDCPYPATVANLEDSIANYKRIIEALSAKKNIPRTKTAVSGGCDNYGVES